jgi:hypothetical protein
MASTFARAQSFTFLSVVANKIPIYLAAIKNEWTLHQRIFDTCHTTHCCPGTFEILRQSLIKRFGACTDTGGGYFWQYYEV